MVYRQTCWSTIPFFVSSICAIFFMNFSPNGVEIMNLNLFGWKYNSVVLVNVTFIPSYKQTILCMPNRFEFWFTFCRKCVCVWALLAGRCCVVRFHVSTTRLLESVPFCSSFVRIPNEQYTSTDRIYAIQVHVWVTVAYREREKKQ